jgi:hypothetical protein
MSTPKTISRDTYLKVLGLFTLGHGYAIKGYEIEAALKATLQVEDEFGGFGHITDEMYSSENGNLDAALERAGYVVADAD